MLPSLKKVFVLLSLKTSGIIVTPPKMAQSKMFYKTLIFEHITINEILQNSKSEPKNSHSCVPLSDWAGSCSILRD